MTGAAARSWLPAPAVLGVLVAILAACGVGGVLLGEPGPVPVPLGVTATLAVAFTPLAVLLLRRLPGNLLGVLMLLAGATATIAALADCWSSLTPVAWLAQWMWWPPVAVIPLLLLVAPDGTLPTRAARTLAALVTAAGSVATIGLAVAALARPHDLLSGVDGPLPSPALEFSLVGLGGLGGVVLAVPAVLVVLGSRGRRADPVVRRQLACLLPSAVLLAVGIGLDAVNVLPFAWVAGLAALPLGLTVAVLRYRLHDLDLYIHRGSVWLVLTALGVGVFALVATGAGALLAQPGSATVSLVAAATVVALLQPLERLTQRAVNRMLYGRRDDPYAVLTELGGHLTALRDPLAVLPQIAETIITSLRVPWAAVLVGPDGDSVIPAAEAGRPGGEPVRFEMVANGRPVGELLVTPRQVGGHFTAAETALLKDLAAQAALAAQACRQTLALQRARDGLVLAREEERRRLRRDLHDGVASALVGSRMLTDAARDAVHDDARSATALLDTLAVDLATATSEVRTLIDGLRPAMLDAGLGAAVEQLVERTPGPTAVTLDVRGNLAELPAAVEVVAYRTVAEALTNVVKHARAGQCAVTVARDERVLSISVVDDGVGFGDPVGPHDGVGLSSIRGRVEEITGRCTITSSAAGTRVEVRLPLA